MIVLANIFVFNIAKNISLETKLSGTHLNLNWTQLLLMPWVPRTQ